VNGKALALGGALMSQVYEQHKDEDGLFSALLLHFDDWFLTFYPSSFCQVSCI